MVAKRVIRLFLPLCVILLLAFGAVSQAHAAPWVQVNVKASGNGEVAINKYSFGAYAYDQVMQDTLVNLTAMSSQYNDFEGWYDDDAGHYVSYEADIWTKASKDINYTAVFKKGTGTLYYVTVDLNDYSGGWISTSAYAGYGGDPITIEAMPATGWVFKGWVDGNGWPVSSDNPYTFNIYSDVYYIAQFEHEDAMYYVYIEPNGGTGYMPDPLLESGSTYTLPECEFTPPAGKEFDSWSVGNPGDQIVINNNMTIYAQWKDIPGYIVHIEPNGGTGYMPDPTIAMNTYYTLPECGFTAPAGKKFKTWDVGKPGEQILVNAETWIYAQWEDDIVYHLVYIDPNGGTGYMPDPYVEHGKEYTLPENAFTAPEGKEFAGWDVGKPGTKITVNDNMSIYAQWKDKAAAVVPSGTDPTASGSSASPDPSASSAAADPSASAASASSGAAAASSGSAASASSSAASPDTSASAASPSSSASSTSASAASASSDAASSSSAASSGSSSAASSSSSSSTSSGSSSATSSGSSSSTASGSGSGSATNGGQSDELPIAPIAGGVVGGAAVVGLIAYFISKRKKDAAASDASAAQATQPIASQVEKHADHARAEEEGFED